MRAPELIGDYRIVDLIGVGGSATVFRAVRPEDDLEVAIKVLADNHSALPESRRRFSVERKLLATLNHPSIANVYDSGETGDGRPYMVMELANRGDLRSRVEDRAARGHRPSEADVMEVGLHLRHALNALRSREIVHRDISPSNILIRANQSSHQPSTAPLTSQRALLGRGERLLLADLGFAKQLDEASGLTRGGGTEGFAPPEQRGSVSVVDHRSDIYSATALIDWLTTGTRLEPRLRAFVDKGMAEEPDERHHDIDHWFDDLASRLSSEAEAETPRGTLATFIDDPNVLFGALVVGLLALVALVGTAISGEDNPVAETTGDEIATEATVSVSDPLADEATATTQPAAPATTENEFPSSPRAYFDTPVDGATIRGELVISGTATSPGGVGVVRLVIRNLDTGQYWHDDAGELRSDLVRIRVDVTPAGATDATWTYRISTSQIPAGTYRIRAWAQAIDGSGDPVGEMRSVTVS